MSMLAERKRRTKWVINPTKKPLWTTDSSGIKFGKELMEKMGWSAGKGLGVNEQGIAEPYKVSYKNDTKGMGFKGNDDDWIEQQDEFNELLNQLRNDNTSVVNIVEEEKVIKSLEEKSKQSRARVHYQKFTRGKDLSRYSDHDLACILGTNKTKNEKSKTEEVTQTESEVIGNCETSFGVTTINSGSIQDYFKKKWITDKGFNNSSKMAGDAAENANESYQKTESYFLNNEQSLISKSEEEKSKKRKCKSSLEENLYNTESKTSQKDYSKDSERLENFENNVKNKKQKGEFLETNVKVEVKKRKKTKDSIIPKNENHLIDVLNYEESKSLVNEVDSYNTVKKQKKEKTHLKFYVIEGEKNYNCVTENKRKINHENNCIPEIFSAENLNRKNAEEFNFEEEITECRKKKKSKKKKSKEIKMLQNEDSCYISSSQNDSEVTEFGLEIDLLKKKKKKEEKDKYLNKDIENKYYNYNEIEDFCDNGEKKIKAASEKEMNEVSGRDAPLYINTVKKRKKKKYKKEKLKKEEESMNCHTGYIEESNLKEKLREKNINTNEQENVLKVQSFRKKKNKKGKTEKLYEKEKADAEIDYGQYKSVLEETSQETNINKVIFNTTEQENEVEGELYQKKKKKKDKKEKKQEERETDNINCCSNSSVQVQVQENPLELELIKKKKKKKYKKEKLNEKEKTKIEFNCDRMEKFFLEETSKEVNINNINIASSKSEWLKKKKSKEDKKEKSVENKESESKEEFGKHLTIENEVRIQKNEKNEKFKSTVIDRKIGLKNNRKTSAFRFTINDTMKECAGVHKHKIELLNEKRADKFYPGQHTNNRVLRLISWSNIAGFKGSNLNDVTGYGFLTKYETNNFK